MSMEDEEEDHKNFCNCDVLANNGKVTADFKRSCTFWNICPKIEVMEPEAWLHLSPGVKLKIMYPNEAERYYSYWISKV